MACCIGGKVDIHHQCRASGLDLEKRTMCQQPGCLGLWQLYIPLGGQTDVACRA